jgi:phytoene dehydrogenase-like protein
VVTHHLMGEHAGAGGWGFIRGGMGTITQAIASYGRTKGLEIRTEAEVTSIDVVDGKVKGVTLADGRSFEAPIVASNVSAKLTFLKFLPRAALPAEFVRDIGGYRTYSTAFKINIACERLPQFASFDSAACGFDTRRTRTSARRSVPGATTGREAGDWSRDPFVTVVTPSYVDDTISPPGKHVVHLFAAAPYAARGGWPSARPTPRRTCCAWSTSTHPLLGRHHRRTGADAARHQAIIGSPHGHLPWRAAGRSALFRAARAALADYRSPIHGLYQCGSSAHPGGGVGGVPGHNAAREILKDRGR